MYVCNKRVPLDTPALRDQLYQFIADGWLVRWDIRECWWTGENWSTWGEVCSNTTLCDTNLTWSTLSLRLSLYSRMKLNKIFSGDLLLQMVKRWNRVSGTISVSIIRVLSPDDDESFKSYITNLYGEDEIV